jgi:hypothetical protein
MDDIILTNFIPGGNACGLMAHDARIEYLSDT